MARTLAIGLTESGTEMSVNEDTFSFDQHVYPDMITGAKKKVPVLLITHSFL